MIHEGWFVAAAAPVLGWALSIEKRLATLKAMSITVTRIDERLEKLVDHIIEKKE